MSQLQPEIQIVQRQRQVLAQPHARPLLQIQLPTQVPTQQHQNDQGHSGFRHPCHSTHSTLLATGDGSAHPEGLPINHFNSCSDPSDTNPKSESRPQILSQGPSRSNSNVILPAPDQEPVSGSRTAPNTRHSERVQTRLDLDDAFATFSEELKRNNAGVSVKADAQAAPALVESKAKADGHESFQSVTFGSSASAPSARAAVSSSSSISTEAAISVPTSAAPSIPSPSSSLSWMTSPKLNLDALRPGSLGPIRTPRIGGYRHSSTGRAQASIPKSNSDFTSGLTSTSSTGLESASSPLLPSLHPTITTATDSKSISILTSTSTLTTNSRSGNVPFFPPPSHAPLAIMCSYSSSPIPFSIAANRDHDCARGRECDLASPSKFIPRMIAVPVVEHVFVDDTDGGGNGKEEKDKGSEDEEDEDEDKEIEIKTDNRKARADDDEENPFIDRTSDGNPFTHPDSKSYIALPADCDEVNRSLDVTFSPKDAMYLLMSIPENTKAEDAIKEGDDGAVVGTTTTKHDDYKAATSVDCGQVREIGEKEKEVSNVLSSTSTMICVDEPRPKFKHNSSFTLSSSSRHTSPPPPVPEFPGPRLEAQILSFITESISGQLKDLSYSNVNANANANANNASDTDSTSDGKPAGTRSDPNFGSPSGSPVFTVIVNDNRSSNYFYGDVCVGAASGSVPGCGDGFDSGSEDRDSTNIGAGASSKTPATGDGEELRGREGEEDEGKEESEDVYEKDLHDYDNEKELDVQEDSEVERPRNDVSEAHCSSCRCLEGNKNLEKVDQEGCQEAEDDAPDKYGLPSSPNPPYRLLEHIESTVENRHEHPESKSSTSKSFEIMLILFCIVFLFWILLFAAAS